MGERDFRSRIMGSAGGRFRGETKPLPSPLGKALENSGPRVGAESLSPAIQPRDGGVESGQAKEEFLADCDERQVHPAVRFQVAKVKALEENKGNKQGKDEVGNGGRVMFETVIERIIGNQRMEQVVFNFLAAVTDFPEEAGGHLGGGQGRRPPPGVGFGHFYPSGALPLPLGNGFFRVEHP